MPVQMGGVGYRKYSRKWFGTGESRAQTQDLMVVFLRLLVTSGILEHEYLVNVESITFRRSYMNKYIHIHVTFKTTIIVSHA